MKPYDHIPGELKGYKQWVCAGSDKIPICPKSGRAASVTDPLTWSTFDEAIRAGFLHIGFVFTDNDPFSGIDLDKPTNAEQEARYRAICETFCSYAEISQSGNGVHIIVRGKIPGNVKRGRVEIYSSKHYLIFTGNVIKDEPITDCQFLLDSMFKQMRSSQGDKHWPDRPETSTDDEIMAMAWSAKNSAKFQALWNGDWQQSHPSQSEADMALLSMLAYYCKSNEQVKRLFLNSALGERKKATRRGYLDDSLAKIRSNEPPEIDLSAISLAKEEPDIVSPAGATSTSHLPQKSDADLQFPAGYVGELAEYFYSSAVRPVREIALLAALAFTAGVVGRSYNISNTGLNQYLVLLAKTGSGKEGASSGIDTLLAAVRPKVPMCDTFIGPASFASGQALIRYLDRHPCFVSVLGEFGITLKQLCDPKANGAQTMLKRVLLDLYTKSGFNKTLQPSVYSDPDKNTKLIQAPNVTILGESTPEEFYDGLDHAHILAGLIPRFSIVEYVGGRPALNKKAGAPPPEGLMDRTIRLMQIALTTQQNRTCQSIQMDEHAHELMDEFEIWTTKLINDGTEIERNLWNRAHLRALKLEALVAVGVDPDLPIVTREIAEWALAFVKREVSQISGRFAKGDVGAGQNKQEADLKRAVEHYLKMNSEQRRAYNTPKVLLDQQLIPHHYLRRYLIKLSSFKNDQRGPNPAVSSLIEQLITDGTLVRISAQVVAEKFQVITAVYAKGPNF